MVDFSELKLEGKNAQKIRDEHHLRSEDFIVKNFKDLVIEDEHQAMIIGRICRGHRKEDLHNKDLFNPHRIYKQYSINVPLLAILLRTADELDLDFARAPLIIYEHITPRDPISKVEWEKHISISGVTICPEDPLIIKSSAVCENPKIHRALKGLESKINSELEDLPNHLHQYRESRKDIPRKFTLEIEAKNYKFYDFKFSLQEREIVNLLMGEKLYGKKEESLRELLKNSLDACRLRRESLKTRGLNYDPEIIFELTPSKDKIIVTDNGFGMDEDVIETYFTKIGKSFYSSPEFTEKKHDFTPVSELGIGILSCFMLANKIIIETKTDNSNPLLIEIDDISDYFLVQDGNRGDTGTTITLFLKPNIELDLKKELTYYATHLEFPVRAILSNSEEHIIKDNAFKKPNLDKYYANNYDFHSITINDDSIEGIIAIFLKGDELLGLKPLERYESKLTFKHSLSNEGIFVNNINLLPTWINSNRLIFTDLNLKRNALDLNVARNNIVQNEKFYKLINLLEAKLIIEIEHFLIRFEQNTTVNSIKSINSLFENYMNYEKAFEEKTDIKSADVLLKLLQRFYYFKYISNYGINYQHYDEFINTGRKIVVLTEYESYKEDHLKQLLSKAQLRNDTFYLLGHYSTNTFIENIFKDISWISFLSLFETETSDELYGIIPKTWKLLRIKNYETSRLFEWPFDYGNTFINRDNKFIDLLIRGKHILKGTIKMAVQGFFRSLKMDLKSDFQKTIEKQRDVLKYFIDAGIISGNDIDNYILTKDDFPHLNIIEPIDFKFNLNSL